MKTMETMETMETTTTTDKERLAAIGRDYLADRARFAKFVAAVAAAPGLVPSLVSVTPINELLCCDPIKGLLRCDVWEFRFAGTLYQLEFRFRNKLAMPMSGIVLLASRDGEEEPVELATLLFNAEGQVERLPQKGLVIPDDAITILSSLLGQFF